MPVCRLSVFLFVFALAPVLRAEVQTLDTSRGFPPIATEARWRERSQVIREQVLVSSGLWPMPEKTPLQARIFGKVERDGYSVEKVYFQSCPGFYVCGNLYRPLGRGPGPFPAILNAHGHWDHGRLEDTDLCSNPGRCVNFAKQGMIAFAYDMVGYNDTHFADAPPTAGFSDLHHRFASNNPVDLLWSVSLMGLQTWNSIRALDFLESLPDVDKTRLAVTGASGGGTQTMILGAIDDRLAAQAPVVMVSHTMQGGCMCENMPGLRVKFSNMEIAAAPAPRPQILVSDTQDWTKTTLEMEGPAIAGIYQLFQAPEKLRYVRYDFPHNYNQTSREAVYQWFDRWLLHQPDQPVREAAFHREADQGLRVFPDGKLPANALSQEGVVQYLIARHRERLQALNPASQIALVKYRAIMQPAWERTLQLDWPPEPARTTFGASIQEADYSCDQPSIVRPGDAAAIKVTRFSPLKPRPARGGAVIVLADPMGETLQARAPRGLARKFLDHGFTVIVATDFEAADADQTSLFFTTYNRTRLQESVADLISICEAAKRLNSQAGHVVLCGTGAAGLWSLLAAPMKSPPPLSDAELPSTVHWFAVTVPEKLKSPPPRYAVFSVKVQRLTVTVPKLMTPPP
ncbi:MAG: alpha/beta hydrolase family protein [Limisphaerales bacterium]